MSKYPSFEAKYNVVDTKGTGIITVRTTQRENGRALAAHRGHLCDPDICEALRLRHCGVLYQHPQDPRSMFDSLSGQLNGNAVKVDDTAVVAAMHESEMACNS